MEGGIVRVKCRAQDDKTMYPASPARARFRTARSRYERTNHEATAPLTPTKGKKAEPKSRKGKYSTWPVCKHNLQTPIHSQVSHIS